MRKDYVSISPAQLRASGQQDVDYVLDRPPFTRYFWTGSGFEPVSWANTLYTAAQLAAKAAAGELTPFATYIPSDANPAYQLWARSASEFSSDTRLISQANLPSTSPPVPAGTLLADPATKVIYGQSNGGGGFTAVGGDVIGVSGTGTVSAPALVVSTGFSTAVAAAMEALSDALPKNSQWTNPYVAEQGVIELGAGRWTLEKPITINLTGASVSRYGLTIRGQGKASTVLYVPPTASPAAFKGADGVWRAMSFVNDGPAKVAYLSLENFSVMSYATQGGDGSTPLADKARWIDLAYCTLARLKWLRAYMRYPTALSLDQYGIAMDSCYYSSAEDVLAGFFNSTQQAPNAAGANKARKGGVGFLLKNNNAFVGRNLCALGGNLGFHLVDEDGMTIYGAQIEDVNKAFLFDGDSSGNRIHGVRHEYSLTSLAMEARDEMYFARFCENTQDNYVEQYLFGAEPFDLKQDFSAERSNRVVAPGSIERMSTKNLLTGVSWSNGPGVTSAAGADWPSSLDPSITSSVEVTADGGYNRNRYSAAIPVNPDWGSVRYRVCVQRVSGAGFLNFELSSKGGTPAGIYKSNPQDPTKKWASSNATVPMASGTWSGGKLTMVCAREHGLQAGIRVRSGTSWGTLTAATDLYVESAPSPTSLVLIAAAAGSIPDPGTITSPGAMTVLSDVISWSFCPDITAAWQEFESNVRIRAYVATAPSLDGSNKVIIPLGSNTLGVQTGSKIRLSGFADSRLNGLDYTVLAGDVVGANLTLSGAAAMAGLVTTATSKGSADYGVASYGFIGLTELAAQVRCVTTNTGQNVVWKIAGECLTPGYSDRMYTA